MVCGTVGAYADHLRFVDEVIGKRPGCNIYAAMSILLLSERTVVLVDTHINEDPGAEQIAESSPSPAAQEMNRLERGPRRWRCCRVPLRLSGSSSSGEKMRAAPAGARARAGNRNRR